MINLKSSHSIESVVYSPKTVQGSFDSTITQNKQNTPLSCYGSAEPSPADEILQKQQDASNQHNINNFGFNMQQVKNNNNQHFTF